jgi:molecular chaperone Hsp33
MSDQVPTSLGVGVLVNRDTSVRQAGGFIVQLMPGATDEVTSALEANVKRVSSITTMLEEGLAPADMLERVLSGLDFEELEVMPASFHCGCNEDRAERAVRALGRAELSDMIEKGEPAETVCNFCGKRYLFGPDRLRAMLAD